METKQNQRQQPRRSGEKRPAAQDPNRKKRQQPAPERRRTKRPAADAAQNARRRENGQREAEAARAQAARQAARQGANSLEQQRPRQAAPLPQEEVYRPAPNQDRHSSENRTPQPQRTSPARSRKKTGKRRPFGMTAARKQSQAASGRTVRPPRKNAPAVIYTQPLPFNLNRMLIRLLTVTALVLAFTMGLSVFFRVEVITVSGAQVYSEWDVREASGIETGDALLTFSRARAGAKIRSELPYVDKIRFGIKLPNTVIIDIEELDVAYAIQATDGLWWFITSDGRVVEQTDEGTASSYTKIRGVTIELPEVNAQAVAWEQKVATDATDAAATDSTDASDGATTPVTITNGDRLDAALQIAKALEVNAVVGQIAEVNVSDLGAITMTYGTRYTVKVGNTDDLEMKIAAMRDAVAQMSEFQQGVLDVTFKIWTDKVVFTPSES